MCLNNINKHNQYRFLWILFWALFVSGMVAMIAGVCTGQPPEPLTGDDNVPDVPDGGYKYTPMHFSNGLSTNEFTLALDLGEGVVNGVAATGRAIGSAIDAVQDVDMNLVSLTTMTKYGAIGGGATLAVGGIYTYLVDLYEKDWFGKQDAEHYNIKHITRWIYVLLICYCIGALCGGLYGRFYGGNDNKMKYAALWAWSLFVGVYTIQRLCMFGYWRADDDEKYKRLKNWGHKTDTSNFCQACGKHGTIKHCKKCEVEHCSSCQNHNCDSHKRAADQEAEQEREKKLALNQKRERKKEAAKQAERQEEMRRLRFRLDQLQRKHRKMAPCADANKRSHSGARRQAKPIPARPRRPNSREGEQKIPGYRL